MNTCPKCGEKLENDARFCTTCGEKIAPECPNCGKELKPGSKFCSGCGANLSKFENERKKQIICPNCGTELESDDVFCNQCGKPINEYSRRAGNTEKLKKSEKDKTIETIHDLIQNLNTEKCKKTKKSIDDFVFVKGGSFEMGYEKHAHPVTVDSFYMCDHTVTQKEYRDVMKRDSPEFKGENRPVELLTWYEAVEYCNAISEKNRFTPCYNIDKIHKDAGNKDSDDDIKWTVTCNFKADGYRLPTEAEWEFAARGGSKRKGYKYSGSNNPDDVAWYDGDVLNGESHDVKNKKPNELGIFDMSGNVNEWCWDWHQYEDCYSSEVQINPVGPSSGERRVIRGGSWFGFLHPITDDRSGSSPSHPCTGDGGLRLVRSAV